MNTKRVLLAGFGLAIVVLGALSATAVLSNAGYDAHSGEKWQTDFEAAQATAQSSDDRMVVYFWSSNCQYCEDFNAKLQNDAALQEAVDQYVMVSADINERQDLASRYDVESTPTVVVVEPNGTAVESFNPSGVDSPAQRLTELAETEQTR